MSQLLTAGMPTASGSSPSRDTDAPLATYFQPFYNLRTGRMQGLEALARRRTPDAEGATESPAAFFDDAATRGRMREIDLWILRDALAHTAAWHQADRAELVLSVNLSAELVCSDTFVDDVSDELARHQVPADRLLVDLSTSAFRRLASTPEARDRLRSLQEREITFCIDGFTADDLDLITEASVPVDIIKLLPLQVAGDHTRLEELARTVQDAGLPVVAAGVETREQLELVRELGFEWAQGFYLGEPVPADEALQHAAAIDEG